MLAPRWRKVLRDIWINKTRTLLAVLSIAVGVFAIGMILHTQILVSRELTAIYAVSSPASATIMTEDAFDDEMVQVVRRMPGVRGAEGRRTTVVRVKIGADAWRAMQLFVIPDYDDIQVNKVWLKRSFDVNPAFGAERGTWPPRTDEVLIERSSLLVPGMLPATAAVGENITIETLDGRQRTLRINGVGHDPNRIPATFANMAYGYITFDTFENLGGTRDFNELSLLVAGDTSDKAAITRVAAEVGEKIERSGRSVAFTQIPEPGKREVVDDIFQGSTLLLGALGVLVLGLSCFLVINTIAALLAQQLRQIGMMKAIGARTRQITAMYFATVLIIGLLAVLIAAPLAALAARETAALMAGFINVDTPSFSLPLEVLLVELLIGLLVPLLAATFPIIGGTRVTVREALAAQGIAAGRKHAARERFLRRFALRLPPIKLRLPPLYRPLLLSLRNTFRRKGRLALTLATLTMSGTIFIAITSVQASLNRTLDDLLQYFQYDIQISLSRPYRVEQIQAEALRVPGVAAVESWAASSVRRLRDDDSEGQTFTLLAPPAATQMLQPVLVEGRWLLPDDQNAIVVSTNVIADEPDLKVGSEMTIKLDGRETTWRIVGVVQVVANRLAYANYPYFAEVSRETGRASSIQIITTQHDAAFQSQVARALEEHFRAQGIRTQGTFTIGEARQSSQLFFNIILSLLLVMAIMLAVVGGFGLTGTMSINVLERTREIGVMRAIGASNRAVRRIVLTEGILIGLLSWAAGMLLALLLSKPLCDAVGLVFLRTAPSYIFSTTGVLIWLGLVVALSAVASLLPAWNASRLTVREVLAYE